MQEIHNLFMYITISHLSVCVIFQLFFIKYFRPFTKDILEIRDMSLRD